MYNYGECAMKSGGVRIGYNDVIVCGREFIMW